MHDHLQPGGDLPDLPGEPRDPDDAKKSFDDVTARLELDYKPNDDMLLYLSYNRGSKSGGYTFSTGTPFAGFEQAFLEGIPFKPEVLNSYELGVKSESRRLDDPQRQRLLLQVRRLPGVRAGRARAVGHQSRCHGEGTRGGAQRARRSMASRCRLDASFLDSKVKNILLPDLVTRRRPRSAAGAEIFRQRACAI